MRSRSKYGAVRTTVEGITFASGRVTVTPTDPTTVTDLAGRVPIWLRMKLAVEGGAQPIEALAADLDTKPDTIRKEIRRKNMFVLLPGGRVGLKSPRGES